jgi:hypothetical protein
VTQPFIYQGFLREGGTPVSRSLPMKFRIYDALGTLRWDSGNLTVPVSNGLFTVQLNTDISIWTGADMFLEIQINPPGGPILSPRVRIGSTPYANTATLLNMFQEGTANPNRMVITHSPAFTNWGLQYRDSDDSFHFLAGGTTRVRIGLGDGNVGIGTTSPATRLDILGGNWNTETTEGDLRVGDAAHRLKIGIATGGGGAGHATIAAQGGVNALSLGAGTTLAAQRTLTILGTGRVGIGTATPLYRLHVVEGSSPGRAVYGEATAPGGLTYGGYFLSASTSGTGVFGWASATIGAAWGVWGRTSSTDSTAYGVRGEEPSDGLGHAVYAFGTLAATGIKSFQIDHPLDPENYYLNHFCTEAPEPLNAYSGNVITDAQGYAVVQLPPYFESINRDFRYQLTVIDGSDEFVLAKVVRKIQNNQFVIRTSKPFVEVSWRVEAVRNDLWVQRYGFQTEQEKEDEIKGRYLHPELYGQPKERGIHYRPEPEPAPNETAKP